MARILCHALFFVLFKGRNDRVRYFNDGAILGSAEFVRGFTGAWQMERGRKHPPKRRRKAPNVENRIRYC